jgi:hypothetical protein
MKNEEIISQEERDLCVTFTIGRPKNEIESEFSSLVFRLLKINDFMKNDRKCDFDIKENNINVLEMQRLLEDFIVKEEI